MIMLFLRTVYLDVGLCSHDLSFRRSCYCFLMSQCVFFLSFFLSLSLSFCVSMGRYSHDPHFTVHRAAVFMRHPTVFRRTMDARYGRSLDTTSRLYDCYYEEIFARSAERRKFPETSCATVEWSDGAIVFVVYTCSCGWWNHRLIATNKKELN